MKLFSCFYRGLGAQSVKCDGATAFSDSNYLSHVDKSNNMGFVHALAVIVDKHGAVMDSSKHKPAGLVCLSMYKFTLTLCRGGNETRDGQEGGGGGGGGKE